MGGNNMIDLYAISCAAGAVFANVDDKHRKKLGLPLLPPHQPPTLKERCMDALCMAIMIMPFVFVATTICLFIYIIVILIP
jgi:hypothetical protein